MNPEFWLERWQKNETGFHQHDINRHLQAFWPQLNPVKGSAVFVPLCGKSRDMLWLRSQGHTILGVEISPKAIAEFFYENGLSPEVGERRHHKQWKANGLILLEGDYFQLGSGDLQNVHHVFDRASLVALPQVLRSNYAQHLQAVLPKHTNVLLVAFEYHQQPMDGPPFSVDEAEIRRLYGRNYSITVLHQQDILDEYPRFRERGLQELQEKVYRLQPLPA